MSAMVSGIALVGSLTLFGWSTAPIAGAVDQTFHYTGAPVTVTVPDDYVGAVMSDLSGRRGRVTGTESVGGERSVVNAEVPETELVRYAVDLRSITAGTGRFSRQFARYDLVPANVADALRSPA